jgi:putative ABC transport system ATP-binding protein
MNRQAAPPLTLDGVSKRFRVGDSEVLAVQEVRATIHDGEIVAIVGPSGSGKTTLLSIAGCLLTPSSGRVFLLGQDVYGMSEGRRAAFRLRHIGFVFQAFNLLPSLNARENVEIALNLAGVAGKAAHLRADQLLEMLDLQHRAHQHPDTLSGGEQQRLAIARALANGPDLILADEPTASLDSQAGHRVMELLRLAVVEREARSLVIVTHDTRILDLAHRVLSMQDGRLADAEGAFGGLNPRHG